MTSEPHVPTEHPHLDSDGPPSLLSPTETAALSALLDGLFPSDELGPGALEIGVLEYLQKAFVGPYRELIPIYRSALAALDDVARREHGQTFAEIGTEQRDAIISRLERGQLRDPDDGDANEFFNLIWQHLREGLFGDPIHGGNRQMMGWRLIGFPGAQFGYSAEEQQLDVAIIRDPRSVAELGTKATEESEK